MIDSWRFHELANRMARPASSDGPKIWLLGSLCWLAAVFLCLLGYLLVSLPLPWTSDQPNRAWTGQVMTLVRGVGGSSGQAILIQDTDPSGVAVVSLETPGLVAAEYRRINWMVEGIGPEVSASLLWRNDYRPGTTHSLPLVPTNQGYFFAWTASDQDWMGRINGLALVIKGRPRKPVRVLSVVASPHTAGQALREVFESWLRFAPWHGAAINTVEAEAPGLPLPPVAAAITLVGTSIYLCLAWLMRWRRQFAMLALLFLFSWLLLDGFWQRRLLVQTWVSADSFRGKSLEERHLAAEDAPVYAFARAALQALPREPSRVIVAAEDGSLRGRLAYYLLPHQVIYQTHSGALPAPSQLRSGDYIVALYRRNFQFNPAESLLRWDGHDAIAVDLLFFEQGNAVLRVR